MYESLASACGLLARSAEDSLRALGWNLRCDHRVSEERAQHFFDVTGRPSTVDDLRRALVDYHVEWVCARPDDTYLSAPLNGGNFVSAREIPEDLSLGTVINLTAWADRLDGAIPGAPPRPGGWVARLEDAARSSDADDFISDIFSVINTRRDQRPVWVARWTDFEACIDLEKGSTWNAAVGVWRKPGTRQVVAKYPASLAGKLTRPTQLDAGYYEYHYPSPPMAKLAVGGYTMGLFETAVSTPLVSEWIHAPFDLKVDQWIEAGRLFGEVSPEGPGLSPVMFYRSNHRGRLQFHFPKCTKWLPAD